MGLFSIIKSLLSNMLQCPITNLNMGKTVVPEANLVPDLVGFKGLTFRSHSAHLANLVCKSGCKTFPFCEWTSCTV